MPGAFPACARLHAGRMMLWRVLCDLSTSEWRHCAHACAQMAHPAGRRPRSPAGGCAPGAAAAAFALLAPVAAVLVADPGPLASFVAIAGAVVMCLKLTSFVHFGASRRRAPAPCPDPPPSRLRVRSARLHSVFAQRNRDTQRAGALAATLQTMALAATLQTMAGCVLLDRAWAAQGGGAARGGGRAGRCRGGVPDRAPHGVVPGRPYPDLPGLLPARAALRAPHRHVRPARPPRAFCTLADSRTCGLQPSAAGLCTKRARLAASSGRQQMCSPTACQPGSVPGAWCESGHTGLDRRLGAARQAGRAAGAVRAGGPGAGGQRDRAGAGRHAGRAGRARPAGRGRRLPAPDRRQPGRVAHAVLRNLRAGPGAGGRGDRLWRPRVLRGARPPPPEGRRLALAAAAHLTWPHARLPGRALPRPRRGARERARGAGACASCSRRT